MILKGRIVGVGLSKSEAVEYVFQPEGIVDFQEGGESTGDFIIQRDKNGRYPMLCFDSPVATVQTANSYDAFSLGYLLMERKELLNIRLKNLVRSGSAYNGSVDSIFIGVGLEKGGK